MQAGHESDPAEAPPEHCQRPPQGTALPAPQPLLAAPTAAERTPPASPPEPSAPPAGCPLPSWQLSEELRGPYPGQPLPAGCGSVAAAGGAGAAGAAPAPRTPSTWGEEAGKRRGVVSAQRGAREPTGAFPVVHLVGWSPPSFPPSLSLPPCRCPAAGPGGLCGALPRTVAPVPSSCHQRNPGTSSCLVPSST